jgi:two-component system, NtrC family, response regulator GlrR
VLLLGETGTGKEWIAGEIHRLSGRSGPLLAVNCAALSAQIIESQLFGHVRGAFTGATSDHKGLFRAADGGTLFLDEIGELPVDLQPKLLRTLQDGQVLAVGATRSAPVDVRVIGATNLDLHAAVEAGSFRRDLYARLAMWELAVPPLRVRRLDILSWIDRLHRAWQRARPGVAASLPALLPDAVEAILLHPWPDNLRGLDRLVHALAATSKPDGGIALADLPRWLRERRTPARESDAPVAGAAPVAAGAAAVAAPATPESDRRPPPTREEFELAYAELGGNVRALARHFRRDRRQIYRWVAAYGLERRD